VQYVRYKNLVKNAIVNSIVTMVFMNSFIFSFLIVVNINVKMLDNSTTLDIICKVKLQCEGKNTELNVIIIAK
jgi:hypothetical protein